MNVSAHYTHLRLVVWVNWHTFVQNKCVCDVQPWKSQGSNWVYSYTHIYWNIWIRLACVLKRQHLFQLLHVQLYVYPSLHVYKCTCIGSVCILPFARFLVMWRCSQITLCSSLWTLGVSNAAHEPISWLFLLAPHSGCALCQNTWKWDRMHGREAWLMQAK